MIEANVKYKNVDKWVYGEVKEIKLIGEDDQLEKGMYYFVFWINHNNQHLSTHVDKCFEEVQSSNMSKLGEDGKPIYNESGKVMKGPKYFKPDLTKFVN